MPRAQDGPQGPLRWLRDVEGAWCQPEAWDPDSLRRDHDLNSALDGDICAWGREAADALRTTARRAGVAAPTSYLAVLAQDADELGVKLGTGHPAGGPLRDWHGRISAALHGAGEAQHAAIENCLGRVVYAGGDDVLALVPLATATRAARDSYAGFRAAVADVLPDATASTALVFFHASSPLQSAVATAQQLLTSAKRHGRPGLGMAVLRRGGERATWISRWSTTSGEDALAQLDVLVAAMRRPDEGDALSARLTMGLERDHDELSSLNGEWLRMELIRRAVRHGISPDGAAALLALCSERGQPAVPPVDATLVAQFLAAESR
jgi:CRISPR-associated protein Cmr2